MKTLCAVVLLAWLGGCSKDNAPANEERASASPDAGVPSTPSKDAGLGESRGATPAVDVSPWTQFARSDDVPLCFFASYTDWFDTAFLKDVKEKVSLKAGQELFLGTFSPGCASLACVRAVTLQCWADVEGKTITVHTRYSGEQRAESSCTKDCESNKAECKTPPLKPGVYQLTYGQQQRTIRIPSVLRPTCI